MTMMSGERLAELRARAHKKAHKAVVKEGLLVKVAQLARMGFTHTDIASRLGVSAATVSNHVKEVKQRYNRTVEADRKELVQRELEVLMDTRRLAYDAFLKSGDPAETVVKETQGRFDCRRCDGTGETGGNEPQVCEKCDGTGLYTPPPKLKRILAGRLPAAEFLRIVLETTKQIREMLGLDEAAKFSLVDGQGVSVFDRVYSALSSGDPIQSRLDRERSRQPLVVEAKALSEAVLAESESPSPDTPATVPPGRASRYSPKG